MHNKNRKERRKIRKICLQCNDRNGSNVLNFQMEKKKNGESTAMRNEGAGKKR